MTFTFGGKRIKSQRCAFKITKSVGPVEYSAVFQSAQ